MLPVKITPPKMSVDGVREGYFKAIQAIQPCSEAISALCVVYWALGRISGWGDGCFPPPAILHGVNLTGAGSLKPSETHLM